MCYRTLKRLAVVSIVIVLIIVGTALMVPMTRSIILGLAKGEPCYQSRPISFWIAEIDDPDKQQEAMLAIRSLGKTSVPYVLEELTHLKSLLSTDDLQNDEIEDIYRTMGLTKLAKERADRIERRYALLRRCIRSLPVEESIPALINALHHDDRRIRRTSAILLSDIDSEAVPALTEALGDEDSAARAGAAFALALIGPTACDCIPGLIAAMSDDDAHVRQWACYALDRVHPDPEVAVPAFERALQDKDPQVRRFAVQALGRIGPAARRSVPALKGLLGDKGGEGLDTLAAKALKEITSGD